jgi:hypothetical protein
MQHNMNIITLRRQRKKIKQKEKATTTKFDIIMTVIKKSA